MISETLKRLYTKHGLNSVAKQHGTISDKLGDVYEEYVVEVFKDIQTCKNHLAGPPNSNQSLVKCILAAIKLDINNIKEISANKSGHKTFSGGPGKTDVIIHATLKNDETPRTIPLSIKHSSKKKVSVAEFDVETICNAVGIPEGELKTLMKKHQLEKSAKNFSSMQKEKLRTLLSPYSEKLVRWVLTHSASQTHNDPNYPEVIVKFDVRNTQYRSVIAEHMDHYVELRLGSKAGFGTGLSWTYATGSAGLKIQFKG